jgi:hypothetical protein
MNIRRSITQPPRRRIDDQDYHFFRMRSVISGSRTFAATVRLVGAMMLEQNDEWSLNRRYMQLEGLQTLSDTVPTRLSAVAR